MASRTGVAGAMAAKMAKSVAPIIGILNGKELAELPRDFHGHPLAFHPDSLICIRRGDEAYSRVTGFSRSCDSCGADLGMWTDGKTLFAISDDESDDMTVDAFAVANAATSPCPHPDGVPVASFNLNVPSGKLVVANDLRPLFPCDEPRDSINGSYGCYAMTMAYAQVGMAHGFVGNTSPAVYLKDSPRDGTRLWIGSFYVDGDDERRDCDDDGFIAAASICTDLWWYSIVDYDEFERRVAASPLKRVKGLSTDEAVRLVGGKVIDVERGLYRVEHDVKQGRRSWNEKEPLRQCYATIRWTGRPSPVFDYLKIEAAKTVTPEQYIAQAARDWPTLYGRGGNIGFARVADQIFCTLGSGIDWHPNGHPRIRLDADIAAGLQALPEIPLFGRNEWYPLSSFSTIVRAAGLEDDGGEVPEKTLHLSTGFAKLAFNVLQSMIWHGLTSYDQLRDRKKDAPKMQLAVRVFWKLFYKYPEAAHGYPEFTEWMLSNRDVLEEYCDVVELDSPSP